MLKGKFFQFSILDEKKLDTGCWFLEKEKKQKEGLKIEIRNKFEKPPFQK